MYQNWSRDGPTTTTATTAANGMSHQTPTAETLCRICLIPIAHFNLGAQICRACAAFYRRTISENASYVCRAAGNCDLQQMKNKCKACRFRRCYELGARLSTQLAVETANLPNVTSTNGECCESLKRCSNEMICDLVDGFEHVLRGQRYLFACTHAEFGFADKYLMPHETLVRNMETQSIPLIMAMFNHTYGPLSQRIRHEKISILKGCFQEISLLMQGYLSAKHFPDIKDRRIMVTNGYYILMEMDVYGEFVRGNKSDDKIPEMKHLAALSMEKYLKNVVKYKTVKARIEDVVVLMCLAAFKHAERLDHWDADMADFREEVIAEWNAEIRHSLGETEGSRQMARILAYSLELDALADELQNNHLLGSVTWPGEKGCNNVHEYIDQLSLN